MNKSIRAAAVKRSDGNCEACQKWAGEAAHCDHFWGRKNSERLETVWMLCPGCDDDKTHNRPSSSHWAWVYATHCLKYQYGIEAERAQLRIDVQKAKGLARRDEK